MATFNLNRDVDTAAQDVRDRVASIVHDLPPDVRPPVIANLTTARGADDLAFGSAIDSRADWWGQIVRPQLERAEVWAGGRGRRTGARLMSGSIRAARRYKIPIRRSQCSGPANADVPGGNVETGKHELVLHISAASLNRARWKAGDQEYQRIAGEDS
jgi:HAE1 family hydrophobic/amphiphilic exporter-1